MRGSRWRICALCGVLRRLGRKIHYDVLFIKSV